MGRLWTGGLEDILVDKTFGEGVRVYTSELKRSLLQRGTEGDMKDRESERDGKVTNLRGPQRHFLLFHT